MTTPHPNPPTTSSKGGGSDDGGDSGSGAPSPPSGPSSSSAPFHSRSATTPRRNGNNNTYYQPSVHQFSCRGAFHLRYKKNDDDDGDHSDDSGRSSRHRSKEGDDLEALLKDTFLCNGIRTKLRHVADYPLAKSKEDAVKWFEGSSPVGGAEVYANNAGGHRDVDNSNADAGDGDGSHDKNNDEEIQAVEFQPESSFSSYGTTQVNILTLQEVPVVQDDARRSPMDDPFGGFGAVANSGMLNPFGSLFGGFFGGGMQDPWSQLSPGEDDGSNNNRNGWLKGSRSVSSSTRMDRDEAGKRVVKTVTKTTVVDNEGKRTTETVTTERHIDDGGRVETQKVVQTDGDENKGAAKNDRSGGDASTGKGSNSANRPRRPMFPPQSPFHSPVAPPAAVAQPTSPAEIAVIATDCLLGVSISDSATSDPDSVVPQTNSPNNDGKAGWRKTEYLFRLGRFIPPFMIVNKYYRDKEEEERRRREIQKEFDDMRMGKRKDRWEKSRDRHSESKEKNARDAGAAPETPITDNLSAVSSRTEYYLQRIYVQMGKNLNMMGTLLNAMAQPDFPGKVQVGGTKILENIGPTAERTGKLMGAVWEMWTGWDGWSGSGGEDGGGRGGPGRRR